MLLEFGTAGAALRFALDVQDAIAVNNREVPADTRIEFRIGINVGDIIIDGDDVAGDGVNVAARLESLAEPGGICVTAAVRDQVHGDATLHFVDIGEQRVKNIARPIHAYRVVARRDLAAHSVRSLPRSWRWMAAALAGVGVLGALAWGAWSYVARTAGDSGPPAMSIAILPFATVGADSDALANSLTRDISTGLARGSQALVVAPHSAASLHRDKAGDPRALGRELNVRYVVEGEVRRDGETTVVSVQMIDTGSAAQVWSERFDIDAPKEGFDRAAFARRLTSRVRGSLFNVEMQRLGATSAQGASARELVWRALSIEGDGTLKATRESGKLMDEALKLEPNLQPALINRAINLATESDLDPRADTAALLRRADELSERAVARDPDDSFAWIGRAVVLGFDGRIEAGLGASKRARELDPTRKGAMTTDARMRLLAGRSQEALSLLGDANKTFPGESETEVRIACWANLQLGRYEDAISLCERAAGMDGYYFDYVLLAAAYGNKGDLAKASIAKVELERRVPGYSIAILQAKKYSRHPDYARQAEAHLYPGLRKAGVPER
jgi:TolB-like protein